MESLPVLDIANFLPLSVGENLTVQPGGQPLPNLTVQPSNASGSPSESENSFGVLLSLLSDQQTNGTEGAAQLRETDLPEPLKFDLKASHHLPPELADIRPKPDPYQGPPNLQALAQNFPAQPVASALQKLLPKSSETGSISGIAAEPAGSKAETGKLLEQPPLVRHEETRVLKEHSALAGKTFPSVESYPESRELKPELAARDFKVIEATPRLETNGKTESQQPISNSQNASTTNINSIAQAPAQSAETKSFHVPVASQVDGQPSMTMRLKEFQDFPNAMGSRLAWLANQDQKTAVIRLDPPELGKLELLLNIDGDKVSVNFQASGNAVRELILQQIDRLRMAMAGHDLDLVNVDVSAERESDRQKDESHTSAAASVSTLMVDESTDESSNLTSGPYTTVSTGFLDTFA
ncbi:MAG: flagellar hook-length control protein FliK [Endozoicomonas sp.]|uniref:flagellar hook-length control protein FliK n=1 Tax=Endozoicomonas sp. TaxID=1892382 RepID=UPI003D9BFC32